MADRKKWNDTVRHARPTVGCSANGRRRSVCVCVCMCVCESEVITMNGVEITISKQYPPRTLIVRIITRKKARV